MGKLTFGLARMFFVGSLKFTLKVIKDSVIIAGLLSIIGLLFFTREIPSLIDFNGFKYVISCLSIGFSLSLLKNCLLLAHRVALLKR